MIASTVVFGLVAAACSSDKKSAATTAPTTAATATTAAPATTTATTASSTTAGSSVTTGTTAPATTAAATTAAPATTAAAATSAAATTVPGKKPVVGGELTMSGEAEVTNPWTPAAMQCDPYCYQRARTFFDELAIVGSDTKVHPFLAESITPNTDFTQWTIKIRSGVKFTDGTDVNADAVIRNLQTTGSGVLLAKLFGDLAKNPDGTFKMVKADDLTFTIFTGKGGDPNQPLPWPGFAYYLTLNWGLIASPKWLDEVKADPTKASQPVGSGPFTVASFTPGDSLVVVKNPNYWLKDANGIQLPYLDKVTFKVIQDSQTAQQALESGDLDMFSTSAAKVISNLRGETDKFPLREQSKYGDTYYLLIDLVKKTPLQDARVRCALSMAIDRKELIDLVGAGIVPVANGVFSPGEEGYLADNGFSTDQNLDAAKQLIADYKKATGAKSIQVELGATADVLTQQASDLLKGYWSKIGVVTKQDVVPQDQYITNALFGAPNFLMYQWRSHSGFFVDNQNFWWNSASGTTEDGKTISVNFGRLNDPSVDADLATGRSDLDPAKRKAAAEDINRTFATQCYQIPLSWTIWATANKPGVDGFDQAALPDGTTWNEAGATETGGYVPTAYMWRDNG